MALNKEQKEQIEQLTSRYVEKLTKRAAEGKDLIVPRKGRVPSGVPEKNMEEYVSLREQLNQLKQLRQESVTRLRELKEQMEALRTGPRPKRKAKK